jgi:hypothetical protein
MPAMVTLLEPVQVYCLEPAHSVLAGAKHMQMHHGSGHDGQQAPILEAERFQPPSIRQRHNKRSGQLILLTKHKHSMFKLCKEVVSGTSQLVQHATRQPAN